MTYDSGLLSEKYQLAIESASKEKPSGGLNGYELEWNLLDESFRPLLTVGSGPGRQSFVDYLRLETLTPWLREFSQLEVFHWMVEFATRPFYSPRGAVFESRLVEAVLINALSRAGGAFGQRLFAWHGNLLALPVIDHDAIPVGWGIAKRRYLERCVDIYGAGLATAGIHVNLSLPEPLFAWDFVHLPASERGRRHLDQYKSEFYITATRLMRAFASLFIATSASTPLRAVQADGRTTVVLTANDSVRNLTFPNPVEIDLPDLYRSYKDYKNISYDLVERGIRFGNNNWTPIRARSFAEPVERLISTTGEQLEQLYTRGLYSIGESLPPEDMARQIEQQNLRARINLPMARVEIRTDDGCHPLEVDVANIALKQLLLLRMYGDPDFACSFTYDREDIARARLNEQHSARDGLRAEISSPLTGKPVKLREFLAWVLGEVLPLAEALGWETDLRPLREMAAGAANTAETMRLQLEAELDGSTEVPVEMLRRLAESREHQVSQDIQAVAASFPSLGTDSAKIAEFLERAREQSAIQPGLPIRLEPPAARIESSYPDKTAEIVDLARHLVQIPSVTATPRERLTEVRRAATFVSDYLRDRGLNVRYFDARYPAVLASFAAAPPATVLLSGHFDVVEPEPDDRQFAPSIDGDYLRGRGAADMKTVVATYMVWMKDTLRMPALPPISMLLVGNEENGEADPVGTPHVLQTLQAESGTRPEFLIAGERTGERGDEIFGEICTQNRGIVRFEVTATGARGHTGVKGAGSGVMDRMLAFRVRLERLFSHGLTLTAEDGWRSQFSFPFLGVGAPGIYNITPGEAVLGVEVRPIPGDDLVALRSEVERLSQEHDLEVRFFSADPGITCPAGDPLLASLLHAVREVSGSEPRLGRKLPATSARFAPGGRGVVWGQSGLGPHSADERHYMPSIKPYYDVLNAFGRLLVSGQAGPTS
jgi:acetylornithine deacetylase/succinyl-diaminopimelate desuccinylase-like protein/gamma-glutamyl:cysteine ligase YbdK (ATP-grasp superfamily)